MGQFRDTESSPLRKPLIGKLGIFVINTRHLATNIGRVPPLRDKYCRSALTG
jgi:hypothetical protein